MTETEEAWGRALYDLAEEERIGSLLLEQAEGLLQCLQAEPGFLRLLSSPALSGQLRQQILEDCLRGRIHAYLLNTLKLMTEKGVIRSFPGCCSIYRTCFDRDHGILRVIATSAFRLSPRQISRLTQKLASVTGKTVVIDNQVDPACFAGLRLDYDGKRIDGTLAHRLKNLGDLLMANVP